MTASAALVPVLPTVDQALSFAVKSMNLGKFRDRVQSVSGCAKPIWLAGSWSACRPDATEVAGRSGQIAVACNNRRGSVCSSCASRYAGDAYHLVHSGLAGGKGVPDSASEHPRLFVTMTAPSFGPVHSRSLTRKGWTRRCSCGEVHHEADTRIGAPLDPDGYDYEGAVLWNAHASELWHLFRIALSRLVAAYLRIRIQDIPRTFRLSYSKVAEYQRRGLVHFHAVIRLDGPAGPGSPAPEVSTEVLDEFIRVAVRATTVDSEPSDTHLGRTLGWGQQIKVDPIAAGDSDDDATVVDRHVAGYVAKYATKGTGATSGVDRRIRHEAHIDDLEVTEHHRRMIRTAWQLGLRRWAHMLGFGGHFLTKSRYYSTTFTALRQVRAEHQRAQHLEELGIDDTENITIINDWQFVGVGWGGSVQAELAEAMASRYRQRRDGGDGG